MNKGLNSSYFVSLMSAETINLFSPKVCFSENERPWYVIRSYRDRFHPQNTKDGTETLRYWRYER